MSDLLIAILLGLVEGITEFVPISSTGHLIVVADLVGADSARWDTFAVFIQLGAILAVGVIYRQRITLLLVPDERPGFAGRRGWGLLALTTLPALVLGATTHNLIKTHLFSPTTVAVGWGLGGVALLAVERFRPAPRPGGIDQLGWREALAIGLFQCFALWPGVSRAGATIVGAVLMRLDRPVAAEYSFLAAMPVLTAAALYDLLQSWHLLDGDDVLPFAGGAAVAFVSAWVAVRFFVRLLSRWTLRPFGWYRIAAALILLLLVANGWFFNA